MLRAAAICAVVFATLPAGCRAPGETNVLRIADNADPASLNPLLAHDQDTIGYDLLVTQTLIGISASNVLLPILVTRVPSRANGDISADGRTIVYHLRRGVRFADGSELTAGDVAFTFRAILDPRNPVLSVDAYRRVDSLQTPNRYTVIVRLKRRWNAAVAELFAQADFAFGVLPAHAFASTDVTKSPWNQHPFGTGPFHVVQWQRADRIVLETNPYFRPRPKLRRIVFELIPTTQSSLLAVRTGNADVAEIAPAQIPQARSIAGVHIAITPVNGAYFLMLQTIAQPTSDVRVRRAIAAALDRAEIIRGSYGALTPADSFLAPVLAWHDSASHSTRKDSAAVAAQLAAAGWQWSDGRWTKNGKPLAVAIALEPERGTSMELIEQEQLRRAGIEAALKRYPAALFNAPDGPLRTGGFTLAAAQWIGGADPEQSVIFACSQRGPDGNNSMNYCNPRFDALFEDQATTADQNRRRRDFIEMQRIVRADAPVIPIAFESNVDVIANRVRNFRRNMLMYPVDSERWAIR